MSVSIVTSLANGSAADIILLNNAMNGKSHHEYCVAMWSARARGLFQGSLKMPTVFGPKAYKKMRDEILVVVEESFK